MLDNDLSSILRTTKGHLNRLRDLGIHTPRALLTYFPWRYSDESDFVTIAELQVDQVMTVRGVITNIFARKTSTGKLMIRAKFSDPTGDIDVMWFNQSYLKRVLKQGMEIILTGKLKWSGSRGSMMSPKYEIPKSGVELIHTGRLVPVYHETDGITSKWLREKIRPLLYMTKFLDDPMPQSVLDKFGLISFADAVEQVHFPDNDDALANARKRLGFQELFMIQLRVLARKKYWNEFAKNSDRQIQNDLSDFFCKLPFELTNAQDRVLSDIVRDMQRDVAMSRLLEGDVGSGKTVVAAAAAYLTIKSGYQVALMVPTEILAKQHYKTMYKYLKDYGFNIQLLTGSLTKSKKDQLVSDVGKGVVDLVVGTHAIIQDSANFNNLGLAIIDEQHRFGVNQRAILKQFNAPHMLSMTATPIPRTLALTIYGDQDISIIDELPPGRQEIITRVVPEKKRDDAYLWINDQISKGRQAFVVCPLVEESETLEIKSAVEEFERLKAGPFKDYRVGLIHGKLHQTEKDFVMQQFADHELDILVSTTVIEVGIDVPNASIMLIEAADRFGLAQLHQLRGRVGRGEHQSYCFLFPEGSSEMSKKRMKAMVDHSDGFKLAEIDLELRGPGEVYGLRQSGIPDLKMASLGDQKLLAAARDSAELILEEDPHLNNYPELRRYVDLSDMAMDY